MSKRLDKAARKQYKALRDLKKGKRSQWEGLEEKTAYSAIGEASQGYSKQFNSCY